ncbi:carbohydrate-binding domain-containing protein [Ruminococcus sp.]|uniref:carbohydrate-binding domain-containing protein n=1 Tax=Ruminococcus sp. TaxID=41978 RepID=UPI0025F43DD8|nr:carbohydrate-binding domain-containing protein [Ruminococcus sp.]MBQ8968021.1 carbohydrate-binding domain-containing protein [Ruminococcus sp.]
MKAMIRRKTISAAAAAVMLLTSTAGMNAYAFEDNGEYDNIFTFTADSVTADNEDGAGFKIKDTVLTINESGVYVVKGECAEGSIQVKKGTTDVVLILDNIDLTSTETSPLTIGKESEVEIVVKGSNVLKDAEDPANETSEDAEIADAFEGAAIKVKSAATATITGSGTLTVDGTECKNGIKGGATASIVVGDSGSSELTLNVNAANNGLASDGSVIVNNGNVNITASGDALKASPDEDDTESAGTVDINGGTLSINGGEDGIQADGGFTMNGGDVTITAAGGHTKTVEDGGKGIKSDSYITITGGTVDIDAADDGIHLNGTEGNEAINITGGSVTVAAGDDGIKSDYYLNIGSEDGTAVPVVTVANSNEGIEGAVINLWSGTGSVTSSDDGMNAANSDLTNFTYELNITGGEWYVDAGGDGLDSNGNMTVTGGFTEVFGSSNNGNGALDYGDHGNTFTVSGGTIVGIGMNGMAVVPTSGNYLVFGAGGGMGGGFGGRGGRGQQSQQQTGGTGISITAGTSIEIKDSQGNTVYSTTGVKNANHIVYSSDELDTSETYTLYLNGSESGTATVSQGNGQSGGFGPGGQQPDDGTGFPARPGDENVQPGDDMPTPPEDGEIPADMPTPPDGGQGQGNMFTIGDVNFDGDVNVTDVALVAANVKSIRALEGDSLMAADVNRDGSVDVTDLMLIAAHVKGIRSLEELRPEMPAQN